MADLHSISMPPALVVAGVHSGVGKTSVAVGLMVALRRKGLRVQPFKVGPDFLDPMHHQAACGIPSVNLDGWMMGHTGCKAAFAHACLQSKADIAVIEGVMGLHDGLDGKSDKGSTAEIAKWLGAPVVLVIDAWCLSRSAAAMVFGYTAFDPDVPFAGVVLNRVAGESHATWLKEAMQSSPLVAHIPVLGCVPKDARVELAERHLGLKMPEEASSTRFEALGTLITENIALDALRQSLSPPQFEVLKKETSFYYRNDEILPPVRIGVARDEAFCFYYDDNLKLLQAAGATLVPFSPLVDAELPGDLQAVYFGGGYPELHGAQLQSNASFRGSVRAFCEAGGFCWAECGGLMYLAQTMGVRHEDDPSVDAGHRFEMVGVLPFDVDMSKRMVMGYCTASPSAALSALLQLSQGVELRCQQFHFSEITLNGEPAVAVDEQGRSMGLHVGEASAYNVRLEQPGSEFAPEGVVCGSIVASYCHVHFGCTPGLAQKIVDAARRRLTVASLLPSGTEALCAMPRLRDRLIAVSSHCDYPPEVVSMPRATASLIRVEGHTSEEVEAQVQRLLAKGVTDFHPLDVEWLRTERPGVILAQDSCPTCDADTSSIKKAMLAAGLEPERVLGVGAANVEQILAMLSVMGAALGEQAHSTLVSQELWSRLDQVSETVSERIKPRVLGLESVCPLVASGQWLPDMRLRAGAEDALGDAPGAAPRRLSWEEVLASTPDVIIISCCGRTANDAAKDVEMYMMSQPGFLELPAMQARPPKLFVVGHALFSRPGPRVVEGVEQLAALIHPTLFPKAAARDALQFHIDDAEMAFNDRSAWLCVSDGTCLETGHRGVLDVSWWIFNSVHGPPAPVAHSLVSKGKADNEFLLFGGKTSGECGVNSVCSSDVWSASVVDNKVFWSMRTCSSVSGELVPTPRSDHAAALWNDDDLLLVFGGWSADGKHSLADLELFHLKTSCWSHGSTTGKTPKARSNPSIVVDQSNNCAVVFGGWDGKNWFADAHVLDLENWRWECVDCNQGPCARTGHVACAWGSEGMVVHGGSSAQGKLSDVWLLRWQGPVSAWRWEQLSQIGDVMQARSLHAALVIGDLLFVTGGQGVGSGGQGVAPSLLDDTGIFSLRDQRWEVGPRLPRAVCQHSILMLHSGVIIVGGYDGSEFLREPWFLFPHPEWAAIWKGVGGSSTKHVDVQKNQIVQPKIVWDASKPLSLQCIKDRAENGDTVAARALLAIERLAPEKRTRATWAMLHRMATQQGKDQYVDPATGYSAFTATYLKKRPCCGFACRHCPHGHANVPKQEQVDVYDW